MSESRQPLTDHVTGTSRPDFSRLGWLAAIAGFILAIIFLVMWYNALTRQHIQESLRGDLTTANQALNAALADNVKASGQIEALQKQIYDLQQDKATSTATAVGLEDEMRQDLESKDITISQLQGKLTLSILDKVLFKSGEAELQPEGEAVMRKIAAFLDGHPRLKIHVVGHTDNIPIRPEARSRFASNWELSTARALAAVHFLTERAGLDPRRVGAVGYGENRPVADNATAEGRAKNRRIAIIILPDELSADDAAPAYIPPAQMMFSTNPPPVPVYTGPQPN